MKSILRECRYNNPDVIKYEQKKLKKDRAQVILRNKAAKVRVPQKSPRNEDRREYKYNKGSPGVNPNHPKIKKWVSSAPDSG